jgi:PIN domain nuclease of toxin-antitoxin system
MQTLLDTHAWVWWVTNDRRLSPRARTSIVRAQSTERLLLSLISLWEVAKKVEKGQLVLDRPITDWLDAAAAQPGLHVVDMTRPILVDSCRLPGTFHGGPADQVIVATARAQDATIVTNDRQIRDYAHVRTTW